MTPQDPSVRKRAVQPALPFAQAPPAAPATAPLLAQARRGVQAAREESDLVERFTGAYLSALRAAAAVLTARGRPHRGRAKPESTWSLLETAAPELAGWAAYFAAFSARHAALQSGASRGADEESANELVQRAGEFLAIADVVVRGQAQSGGRGAATPCEATVPWPRSRRR
nr:SAV_6107 family HEPN domain-containing protein [Prauserella isguenensis]